MFKPHCNQPCNLQLLHDQRRSSCTLQTLVTLRWHAKRCKQTRSPRLLRATDQDQLDHTAVTVNIALSNDFDGGGTFMRASSKAAPTEAGRSSQVSK